MKYSKGELQWCAYAAGFCSKGPALAVDIKNAFKLHPTCRLNKEHLSNGGRQVSLLWVSKLAYSCSAVH